MLDIAPVTSGTPLTAHVAKQHYHSDDRDTLGFSVPTIPARRPLT